MVAVFNNNGVKINEREIYKATEIPEFTTQIICLLLEENENYTQFIN